MVWRVFALLYHVALFIVYRQMGLFVELNGLRGFISCDFTKELKTQEAS